MTPNSLPSRAALYREWRVNRTLYIVAFFAAIVPWILQWQGLMQIARIKPFFASSLVTEYAGAGAAPQAVVALLLALAIFLNDWGRGRLSFVLEGPLSRTDILQAKMWWAGLTVVAGSLAAALTVSLGSLSLGEPGAYGKIASTLLLVVGIRLAMVASGLAVSSAIGNLVYGILAALLVAGVPGLVGNMASFVATLCYGPNVAINFWPPWLEMTINGVQHFEPLATSVAWRAGSWRDLAGYLVWILILGGLSFRWFKRAPYERLRDPFFFRWMWNLVYAFWAWWTATVTMALSRTTASPHLGSVVLWIGVFVVGFFIWRMVIVAIGSFRMKGLGGRFYGSNGRHG
ncbi:hypothetical protein [Sulfobacillus harzensis]|uniref:ABC transporter permease n=1 Tax=Sulfobacillus harzensis TaxID=2729629 RepID=A0A7Y0L061_9FIRM|nr:hypothetical protein [Sulfobacillus harzensis]NMP20894.1 hypothetical protein [Sulfobacillus harzensis]